MRRCTFGRQARRGSQRLSAANPRSHVMIRQATCDVALLWAVWAALASPVAVDAADKSGVASHPTALKRESFDNDPGWESSNNRLVTNSGATIFRAFPARIVIE